MRTRHHVTSRKQKIKTVEYESLAHFGARLSNAPRKYIGQYNKTIDSFKEKLDKYLLTIDDESSIPG